MSFFGVHSGKLHSGTCLVAWRIRALLAGVLLCNALPRAWNRQFQFELAEADELQQQDDGSEDKDGARENRIRFRKVRGPLRCIRNGLFKERLCLQIVWPGFQVLRLAYLREPSAAARPCPRAHFPAVLHWSGRSVPL